MQKTLRRYNGTEIIAVSGVLDLVQVIKILHDVVVVFPLLNGAPPRREMRRLDTLTEPYGGLGAFPRARQPSHLILSGALTRLEASGLIMPLIFLSVAAFLVNVVLSRIVAVHEGPIETAVYR